MNKEGSSYLNGVLVILSSAIISVYVFILHQITIHEEGQDVVQEVATTIAQELSLVTVQHQRLGEIGLCEVLCQLTDSEGSWHRTIGLNNLYATLRLDAIIGNRLKLPLFKKLISNDLKEVRKIEHELNLALHQAVQPNYFFEDQKKVTHAIYQHAYRTIKSAGLLDQENLVDLKIELGSVNDNKFLSMVPAPQIREDASAPYREGAFYRSGVAVPVPIPGETPVTFVPLAAAPILVDPRHFVAVDSLPSAVYLEAIYKVPVKPGKNEMLRKRIACALVGAPPVALPQTAFMISFPYGCLLRFQCFRDLLNYKYWQTLGEWQQAIQGSLPGKGHLVPPLGTEFHEMIPSEAITLTLYQWLLHLGPTVQLDALDSLLDKSWVNHQLYLEKSKVEPNSALTQDSGARTYALFYQSGPEGLGQEVLKNAFNAKSSSFFPASALPLFVDAKGYCNLPGHTGLDLSLVADFFQALHQTNLSSIESKSTAAAIIDRLSFAIKQIDQSLTLKQEELRSISQRLARTDPLLAAQMMSRQLNLLRKRKEDLELAIAVDIAKRKHYLAVKDYASQISFNAERIATLTFEICSHLASYTREGLARVSAPVKGFLLNKKLLFIPHTQRVKEEDIYAFRAKKFEQTANNDLALQEARDPLTVEGISLAAYLQRDTKLLSAAPLFVILRSSEITLQKSPTWKFLNYSPFSNTLLSPGGLVYYAADALRTGSNPEVGWSILLRNMVAYKDETGGEPILPSSTSWCKDKEIDFTPCPGLAVEVQIRAPIPMIANFQGGSYLVNPITQERIAQTPPLPAEML